MNKNIIYKYQLGRILNSSVQVMVPEVFEVLSVRFQFRDIQVWGRTTHGAEPVRSLIFHIVGTGIYYTIPENARYIDTLMDGDYVFHVFVEGEDV